MKRRFAVLLPLALAACQDVTETTSPLTTDAGAPSFSAAQASEFVAGEVLVQFAANARVPAVAAEHGARAKRQLLLAGVWVLEVPAGREIAVATALSRNPNVRFAEPNFIRTFGMPCETTGCSLPADPFFGYKWDLNNDGTLNNSTGAFVVNSGKADADIDWLETYDLLGPAFAGSAVVGIIDTGVMSTHPDLLGRVLPGYDFVNNDADPADDDGHGTHVAGIAAGRSDATGVTGVAYGANIRILPVKVCGPTGCPTSAIVDGITYAANQGANVINLSLGGRYGSASEQAALQYALSKNTLPFCATGNDRRSTISYPAAFAECVAVGATDWLDGRASYSNYGTGIDIAAPGGDSENRNGYSYILSASNDGGYVFMAGTSMATPQAAGLAALVHASGVTGAQAIRARITGTVDDLGTAGWDKYFGAGRINAYRAIAAN